MEQQKIAAAALAAIKEHVSKGVGTRPMADWTDRDVTDTGILCRALSEAGLNNSDSEAEKLEEVVSPLVFWQYHGDTVNEAMQKQAIQASLAILEAGGVSYTLPPPCEPRLKGAGPGI